MKSAITLGIGVTLGAIGFFGEVPQAYAVNANHSGTVCRNYNAGEALDIDYFYYGTRNISSTGKYVVCPIVRAPNAASGYIDGRIYDGETIYCTVYSVNYTGAYLGSTSFSVTGPTTFDRYFSFPSTQVSYWGNMSALCYLPGNGQGVIYDIDVIQ